MTVYINGGELFLLVAAWFVMRIIVMRAQARARREIERTERQAARARERARGKACVGDFDLSNPAQFTMKMEAVL